MTSAQEIGAPTDDQTVGVQGGRFGIGLASSWPAYGLSGTLQISETLTAEALLGALGTVTTFGGRLWYRFDPNPNYDLYGYGAVGVYRYGYDTFDSSLNRTRGTESVLGLGAGAGIEAGLQRLFKDETFPPIFINAEVGLAFANFDYYNFSSFVFGTGIHYRFGGD